MIQNPRRNLWILCVTVYVVGQTPVISHTFFMREGTPGTVKKMPAESRFCGHLAEKEGFEPSPRFSHATPLAGEPLRPLGYFSKKAKHLSFIWRRARDSNPRCLAASPVFKTGSINHSDSSPDDQALVQYSNSPAVLSSNTALFYPHFEGSAAGIPGARHRTVPAAYPAYFCGFERSID